MEETYAYCIQCKDTTSGQIGSFMYSNREPFKAVSPVFENVGALFLWFQQQGYTLGNAPGDMRVYRVLTKGGTTLK